ncbi:MAG: DUF971 domain-containing protein [Deltaproteobacteria bacterium]|nr:DUF971 domain-containing protein [Deltaproteobacteria bacterium]
MNLKKLNEKKPKDILFAEDLTIEWRDGAVAHYPFFYLRDICPCAKCVDEMSGTKVLDSKTIPPDIHIKKAEYVGNYALRITWSDEHDSGIFHFSLLRGLFDEAQEKGGIPGGPYARSI